MKLQVILDSILSSATHFLCDFGENAWHFKVLFHRHLNESLDWYLRFFSWCPLVFKHSTICWCTALEWTHQALMRGMCGPCAEIKLPQWQEVTTAAPQGPCLTCWPSVPSAVTMATECVPAEEMTASWAGTVMVVPSWVTMVMVLPRACMSAWEMFTCNTQHLLSQGRVSPAAGRASLRLPHGLGPNSSWPFRYTYLSAENNMALRGCILNPRAYNSTLISASQITVSQIIYACVLHRGQWDSRLHHLMYFDLDGNKEAYEGLEFKPQINNP